jgi:hypothetical protein
MKKFLLFAITIAFGMTVMAQFKPVQLTKYQQNLKLPAQSAIDNQVVASQPANNFVNTKAVMDDIIGASRYDMQSNGAVANHRVHLWPDNTVSAVWTMAMADPGYSDRGAGYNYYNGSAWGPAPSARVETIRCGWPSVHPWGAAGEMIISHNSTVNLVMNTRPAKGTGSWTQTLITPAPAGVTGLIWPRVVTNGTNNKNIHILVVTTPVANGGVAYQGLDGALIYYRSQDGGTTWDKQGIVLPGMTSTDYLGFSGDSYTWAEPHGDTLAFVYGDDWSDTFLMMSTDNGETWTKKLIVQNFFKMEPSGNVTPNFPTCDGTTAAVIGKNGTVHVAFGRMRAKGDADGRKYYPYTDGLVYWNSTMAAIDTTTLTDINALYDAGLLIGYVNDPGTGDTIIAFPKYFTSLSAFPQMVYDNYDNLYFLWSGVTVGNPSPDPYNYRHIWARPWFHDKTAWSEMKDLNESVLYMFMEYAYPAVATGTKNNKVLLLTQTSSQPGSNIKDTSIPIHDVNIEYREVDLSEFITTGTGNGTKNNITTVTQNYPNPVQDFTSFKVSLTKAANVSIDVLNVMGQTVMTMDKGLVSAGPQSYTIDCGNLTSGIYFYTVKINGESYTHKMIVK